MKTTFFAWLGIFLLIVATPGLRAQELVKAKDGSGVYGYRTSPVQPWSGYHVHDPDRPYPPRVTVTPLTAPAPVPSDAVVLFDGKDLSAFEPSGWKLVDGCIEATSGNLVSK